MRARPPEPVAVRAGRPGGAAPVALPARVLRVPHARPALRSVPGAGRAGQRVSAGPRMEDRRGLRAAAAPPPLVGLLLEAAAPIPDRRPPDLRAVPEPAEPRAAGAGAHMLAALCGSPRLFPAF